jgi:hypothetical protein
MVEVRVPEIRRLLGHQLSEETLSSELTNRQLEEALQRLETSGAKSSRIDRIVTHFEQISTSITSGPDLKYTETTAEPTAPNSKLVNGVFILYPVIKRCVSALIGVIKTLGFQYTMVLKVQAEGPLRSFRQTLNKPTFP